MSAVGRSNLAYALSGVALGLLIAFVVFVPTVRSSVILERQGPYNLLATVQVIRDNASNLGWTVNRIGNSDVFREEIKNSVVCRSPLDGLTDLLP